MRRILILINTIDHQFKINSIDFNRNQYKGKSGAAINYSGLFFINQFQLRTVVPPTPFRRRPCFRLATDKCPLLLHLFPFLFRWLADSFPTFFPKCFLSDPSAGCPWGNFLPPPYLIQVHSSDARLITRFESFSLSSNTASFSSGVIESDKGSEGEIFKWLYDEGYPLFNIAPLSHLKPWS